MKTLFTHSYGLLALAGAALLTSGCGAMRGESASGATATTTTTTSAGPKAGVDAQGNVTDSSKAGAGSGRVVKGMNNVEGEIIGNPARNSRFESLQIGMSARQVTDLIGQPNDQGAYLTGKAFIPFYFGGDRHRQEYAYKGAGRLVFAGGSLGDLSGLRLTRIVHNPNDTGYR